jgi:hypothetical protein
MLGWHVTRILPDAQMHDIALRTTQTEWDGAAV